MITKTCIYCILGMSLLHNDVAGKQKRKNRTLSSVEDPVEKQVFQKGEWVDPMLGKRADWMRGAFGINWKPVRYYNQFSERNLSIQPFLKQIKDFKAIDYIQVHLNESSIYSASHTAPHPILEQLWQGDVGEDGQPINMVAPRAVSGRDPFRSWLEAIKADGMKTMVYVNSGQLLWKAPDVIGKVKERWMKYCDTNPDVQAFIKSKPYHDLEEYPERKYMFCYAEFILKEYAVRYGELIDAWCFDTARYMITNGDKLTTGKIEDQRILEAFANAVHIGNPNAAVAFNHGARTKEASCFDDFTFGHPYGGAGDMVEDKGLYNRNFGICQKFSKTKGSFFANDNRGWNDNVVGHFDPKMSTTSWNNGLKGCLTNEQFVEWNEVGLVNGGAISWGMALLQPDSNRATAPRLIARPWAFEQLRLCDEHLARVQFPDKPNWARADTFFPTAYHGHEYSRTITDGVDFWDPSKATITNLLVRGKRPAWLKIAKTCNKPIAWTFSGMPVVSKGSSYTITLAVKNSDGIITNRDIILKTSAQNPPLPRVEEPEEQVVVPPKKRRRRKKN